MQESEGGVFVSPRPSECEKFHSAENPLEFNGVCPACAAEAPMGLLEMQGFYSLTDDVIDAMVNETSPGNYAVGYLDAGTFQVFYVGRSDVDVNHRLHNWVGMPCRYSRLAPSTHASCGLRRHGPLPLGRPTIDHVGSSVDSSYTHFAFSYSSSALEAFDKECRNYHAFGGAHGLDNVSHPLSLPGTLWRCLVDDQ